MAKTKKDKKLRFSNAVRIENRRARHDYEILETFEAGIILEGCEVKSIRQGHASLNEVYCVPVRETFVLRGMHVKPYEEAAYGNVDAYRDRKLLLHKREISRLAGSVTAKGLTVVPLALYFNERGYAKVKIGLARGKKAHDKRATIKDRDMKRDMQREMKVR